MYFCIRDDDTSFFTSPEELEHAYGSLSRSGPISLAVIPFCRAGSSRGVPASYRNRQSIHPLHDNTPLVEYLRTGVRDGRFEIMLHGYHHDEPDGLPEFAGGRGLRRRVADGRRYLEQLLGARVTVFVPPHNAIGREGLRAIAAEGLHLAGAAGVRAGWPLASPITWRTWRVLRRWRKSGGLGTPWVLDLGSHRELPGVPVTPASTFHRNAMLLQQALASGTVFCLATHYWELGARAGGGPLSSVGVHLRRLTERTMAEAGVAWRAVGEVLAEPKAVL
jgi:predicted deacetylase